ncbi:MAG TPA: hypothetical protein VGR35_07020 [Tepidisphaeraceae bacterium]|nr:hypothetical protein [Tepidisphaeraceae bacterium]
MSQEHPSEQSERIEPLLPAAAANGVPPGEHSTGGAKLFVIFFLALIPLLGVAIVALVIYGLLMR